MNCDLRFRSLGKPKMNCDFASRSLRKPKMNYDFASRSVRRRKKESRLGFTESPETQKRIAILLHGVPGDAKMNCDWALPRDGETQKELRYPCNASLKLGR